MLPPNLLILTLSSYALGCISVAYYLVRVQTGGDIRDVGSGNAGARNVGRVLGRGGFALVFLLDAAKGALAVWMARKLGFGVAGELLAMLAVVAGHVWPAQLGFRGGKGVSTAYGALLVLDWRLALAGQALCLAGAAVSRQFVLSGLVAISLVPAIALGLGLAAPTVLSLAVLGALIVWAHRTNLRELRTGARRLEAGQ